MGREYVKYNEGESMSIIDSLFGSVNNLALAVLITSGIGILFIGSVLISKYHRWSKRKKEKV